MSDNILELEEFNAQLQTGVAVLGLDLGSKTIGIALSDTTRSIATPIETLKRTKFTKNTPSVSQCYTRAPSYHEVLASVTLEHQVITKC